MADTAAEPEPAGTTAAESQPTMKLSLELKEHVDGAQQLEDDDGGGKVEAGEGEPPVEPEQSPWSPPSSRNIAPPGSPTQRSSTASPSTLRELAEALSRVEKQAGRPAITTEALSLWSEANFDELLKAQDPPLPLTVRVSLAQEQRTLATVGPMKPLPAPGFANLTEDAVAAIEYEFKKCQQKAGDKKYLNEVEIVEFFESLGIAEKQHIDAVREEHRSNSSSSNASTFYTMSGHRPTASEHLTWLFRDIDAKRNYRVDW
eukprot:COSAG02_NODE_3047_length_7477_cov_15.840201_9_plen_260_part_00